MSEFRPSNLEHAKSELLRLIQDFKENKRWGKIEIAYQDGIFTTLRSEITQRLDKQHFNSPPER